MNNSREILQEAPAVYVVTKGEGKAVCGEQEWQLKRGDYFFLPYAAKEKTVLQTDREIQVVVCMPPIKNEEQST